MVQTRLNCFRTSLQISKHGEYKTVQYSFSFEEKKDTDLKLKKNFFSNFRFRGGQTVNIPFIWLFKTYLSLFDADSMDFIFV